MAILPGMAHAGPIPGPLCGPGTDWVNTCTGGRYGFTSNTAATVNLDLNRNGSFDAGETNLPILFTGNTSVFLGAGAGDGIANNANDGPLFSTGHIDQQASPNQNLANSFFDVFFELTVPDPFGAPLVLTNHNPNPGQPEIHRCMWIALG